MEIKVKKLVPEAVIPHKAHYDDACFDVHATSCAWDAAKQCYVYGTGLAFEVPQGYVMHIYPRSSIRNYNVVLANSVGVLDSCYRGELMVSFKPTVHNEYPPYAVGDRIAQICIDKVLPVSFEEVDVIGVTERGTGGHGSTGK